METARFLLAKNLKVLRESRGLTQANLAELAGLSLKMIQKIEYGKTSPTPETLDKLAQALKAAVSDLWAHEPPMAREASPSAEAKAPPGYEDVTLNDIARGLSYIKDRLPNEPLSNDEKALLKAFRVAAHRPVSRALSLLFLDPSPTNRRRFAEFLLQIDSGQVRQTQRQLAEVQSVISFPKAKK